MGWSDFGFNFRATQPFVADAPNEVAVFATDAYPATKTNANGDSASFGWTNLDQQLTGNSNAGELVLDLGYRFYPF